MGYACPVCGTPQRDAEHLAHHLAFVAMLHGDGHEAWLDEHAPGWDGAGPDELGPRVAVRAEEATYEEVFEDTVHDDPGRPFPDRTGGDAGAADAGGGPADEATRAALAEAREMTRRMYGAGGRHGAEDREGGDGDGADDGVRGEGTEDGSEDATDDGTEDAEEKA